MKAFVEIEAGSRKKNRYDERTLKLKESFTGRKEYPYAYGFILGTETEKEDALDCYFITDQKLKEGDTMDCSLLGVLEFFEDEEKDYKFLVAAPGENLVLDETLRRELRGELETFLTEVFKLFPEVKIRVGQLLGKREAEEVIRTRMPKV